MAKRYDQKKKDEVVTFIQKYNSKNGRGGQSAAGEKFGINPITVRSWMDKAGVPAPGKKSKKVKRSKAAAVKKAAPKPVATSTVSTLRRMTEIQDQLESLNKEYRSLKASL